MEKATAEIIVNTYAIISWVYAIILIFGGLAILIVGPDRIANRIETFPNQVMNLSAELLHTLAIIFLVIAACYIIVGIGIWNRRSWARVAAIITNVFQLFSFPIGTIIGCIGIWAFGFDDAVKQLFAAPSLMEMKPTKPAKRTPTKKKKR